MGKLKVLFLCTGNSCRSQMAEGWARHLHGDLVEAYSAGLSPHGLNPEAVASMARAGVDISGHTSDHLDAFNAVPLDVIYTVCGHADDNCPVVPGPTQVIHRGFDDPPALARDVGSAEEIRAIYDRVRDEIRAFISSKAFLPDGNLS